LKIPRLIALAVLLCLCGVAAAQETTPSNFSADDEAALRSLAQRFYQAGESSDLTEFFSLWSSRSTDPESKTVDRSKLKGFHPETLTVLGITTRDLLPSMYSDETLPSIARVHVSIKAEPRPQAGYVNSDRLMTLRCAKEDGVWKVLEHMDTAEDVAQEKGTEIAQAIIDANSHERRAALYAAAASAENSDRLISWLTDAIGRKANEVEKTDFEKWLRLSLLNVEAATEMGHTKAVGAGGLSEIAAAYGRRGDQTRQLEYYLRSLELSDASPDPKTRTWNNSLRANIGAIYHSQGDYEQALVWYERALNKENPQAGVIGNIAHAYLDLGDFPRALEYANQSLTVAKKMRASPIRDGAIVSALIGIAGCYKANGEYPQALEYYDRALRLAENSKWPVSDPRLADIAKTAMRPIPDILSFIAQVYLLQGNTPRALEVVERIMADPPPNSGAGLNLGLLNTAGQVYRAAGLNEKARKVLDQAITGVEYRRSHTAGGEENRQRLFEQLILPYHEMIKVLASENSSAEAFSYAERSKARALLDVLDSGRVEVNKAMTPAEQKQDADWRRKIAMLNVELDKSRQAEDKSRITASESKLNQARLEYEAFQTNLYSLHPDLSVTRGELKPLNFAEISGLIPNPTSALLEYVVTDEKTFAFVITKGAKSRPVLRLIQIDIRQAELEKLVQHYRDQLAQGAPDFQKSSQQLFALLLKPVEAELRGASSLIIVPDGSLWDLPFQALEAENQRYLIEDHTVSYAQSLTTLREFVKRRGNAARKSNDLELLAFGNPELNGKDVKERVKTGLMDYALEPLPEAEKMVTALGGLYGATKSRVYIGAAATEDRAKAEAPNSRIIQFATHGLLDSRNPMYSHLVLSQSARNEADDGLLEAWEIMKLDLHADLVVLAACETARGRVATGEGMIGMSWAFFVAGSPTTVASQWKVDSASTTQLMLEFHRNLKSRSQTSGPPMSKARALQMAELKMLTSKSYQHPFYWAGFVMVGDGN